MLLFVNNSKVIINENCFIEECSIIEVHLGYNITIGSYTILVLFAFVVAANLRSQRSRKIKLQGIGVGGNINGFRPANRGWDLLYCQWSKLRWFL